MSDTGCRVIICGKGTAGAVAQAAAVQLQLVGSQLASQVALLPAFMARSCLHSQRSWFCAAPRNAFSGNLQFRQVLVLYPPAPLSTCIPTAMGESYKRRAQLHAASLDMQLCLPSFHLQLITPFLVGKVYLNLNMNLYCVLMQGSDSNCEAVCDECSKVLCVTFGAPPALQPARHVQGLVWNFLLAKKEVEPQLQFEEYMYLWDILPAVMSTVPLSPDSSISWLEAVQDVIAAQDTSRGTAPREQFTRKLDSAVEDLLAAGERFCV